MTDEQLTFSHLLRAATADAHTSAESHAYISSLMAGELDASAVADLLLQTYPVYVALEAGLARHREAPCVAALDDRALDRVAALESDLAWHFTPRWRARIDTGEIGYYPATLAYVAELESSGPEALVAHHYVRYLGDLSGGLAIRALVQRHYGLPDEALGFYSFPGIPKPKVYKDAYRSKLDCLPLDGAARQRVLNHAVRAFGLNAAIFAALSHHLGRVAHLAG